MNEADRIKTLRREVLVNLKMVYPAAFQGQPLFEALLMVFPDYEWSHFRQDLAYLIAKGYLARLMPQSHANPEGVPWPRRWFALTAAGVEIADKVRFDEALEV